MWVDGELVIDEWTWHPPKRIDAELERAELERAECGPMEIRVEHFELDGWALLEVDLEPAG